MKNITCEFTCTDIVESGRAHTHIERKNEPCEACHESQAVRTPCDDAATVIVYFPKGPKKSCPDHLEWLKSVDPGYMKTAQIEAIK